MGQYGRYGEANVEFNLLARVSDEFEQMADNLCDRLSASGMSPDDVGAVMYPMTDNLDVADGLLMDVRRSGVSCARARRCYGYVMDSAEKIVRDHDLGVEFETPAFDELDWE